jgi:hypothetical protein
MAITLEPGQSVVLVEQDKDATKPYRFQLGSFLSPGDPLVAATWTSDSPIQISNSTHDATDVVAFFACLGALPKTWYACTLTWTAQSGASDQIVVRIFIKEDAELAEVLGSALFPNKFTAVAQMRRDRLMVAAQNHFAGIKLESAYIWEKLRAAEAQVSRTLRVKFQPTIFFPLEPTQEQINALNGMPWEVDPGYDYDPAMYRADRWGFFQTHHLPIQSVESLRFAYPSTGGTVFDIPDEWLQLHKKYGHVQIVPISPTAAAMLNPSMLSIISSGKVIPNMIQITYTAGLKNAAEDYPELVDVVKKLAVLKAIEDGFLPQTGSISADGLSQSMSMDMGKYEDAIDAVLNGGAGTNGGLKAAIHGIRLAVM